MYRTLLLATLAISLGACTAGNQPPRTEGEASAALVKKLVLEHQNVEAKGTMVTVRGAIRNTSERSISRVNLQTTCTKNGRKEDVRFTVGDARDETQIAKPGKALRFIVEMPSLEPISTCGKLSITGAGALGD